MKEKNIPSLLERLGRTRRLRSAICDERERLYRLAWSWSHDQHMAEDLVQETLVRCLLYTSDAADES